MSISADKIRTSKLVCHEFSKRKKCLLILKQKIPHLKRVVIGFVLVWIGLTLFIVGLEKALFPLGKLMADQLTSPDFIGTRYLIGFDGNSQE
jgi:hypothetical protein